MKRRALVALGAASALVGAGVALASVSARTSYPVLVLEQRVRAGATGSALNAKRSGNQVDVLNVVSSTLDEADRAALTAAAVTMADRLEARWNPLVEDLEDGEPDAEMRGWAARHSRSL